MSGFVGQLRLEEKTAEDTCFSKVDRELIKALNKRMQASESRIYFIGLRIIS